MSSPQFKLHKRPVVGHQAISWTDDLPVCHLSAVGFSTNQVYRPDGGRNEEHEFEDRFFHFKSDTGAYLYGMFDGHDGTRVAEFALQRFPAELLLGQLPDSGNDSKIKSVLQQAFLNVEHQSNEAIDEALADRTRAKYKLPEGNTDYDLYKSHPELVAQIQHLDAQIAGGTTAVVCLIHKHKLYLGNVGDSRALLVTRANGKLNVKQISTDHNTSNEDELLRLDQLGLDTTKLSKGRQLGGHENTRSLGDYSMKGGYKEFDIISMASGEPVIAEPYVIGGIPLAGECGFLCMFTNGLYKSLEEATATTHVNQDIAYMVAQEFNVQSTLSGVAQGVVDKVLRIHHDTYLQNNMRAKFCEKRDDITLLVRNFNFPLGNSLRQTYNSPVTVPYSESNVRSDPPTLYIPSLSPPPLDSMPALQIVPESVTPTPHMPVVSTPSPVTSSHTSTVDSHESLPLDQSPQNTQDTKSSEGSGPQPNMVSCIIDTMNKHNNDEEEPDADGLIQSYVDFTEFITKYNAAIANLE
ncbi:TGF-beta-activated kinase 1 and MAP3K7-binding protein 1-like [Antedon mediterranea]|uniref:TGF-beta-activated kinase 1 and MAP3K7-binding protein 1-like n=1 Tax=Antedon mediterranea TaxID=105859 RepID=UPI003AF5E0A1